SAGIGTSNYVILGVLGGLTGEISISGILASIVLAAQQKKSGRNWAFIIMTNFNLACIFYMGNIFYDLYLVESNCVSGQYIGNSSSHYFYLSFDFFILFKSYVVSCFDVWVFRLGFLIFLNRLFWTALDIYSSGGRWDPEIMNCNYVQNPLSGMGYNASDIVVDVFCTIVSLIFTWKHLKSKISRIGEVILQENVIRSAVMLSVNNARCLNSELFWMGVRKKSVTQSVNQSHAINEAKDSLTSNSDQSRSTQADSMMERGSVVNSRLSTRSKQPLLVPPAKEGRTRASTASSGG
ncbi:hypothetical protein BDR26DRAFT_877513, partial [Obelidium mucronatum]